MTEEQVTNEAYRISSILDSVYLQTLDEMGGLIKYIGEHKEITTLEAMTESAIIMMNMNVALKPALIKTIEEVDKILEECAYDTVDEMFIAFENTGISRNKIQYKMIDNIINQYSSIIKDNIINISNTRAVNKNYVKAVNNACMTVATKTEDYNTAMRNTVKEMAGNANIIEYKSGAKRRLDSAIRMNIQDGVRRINEDVRENVGNEFGADGYEISMHALCADDHLHIQGKQYSKAEFERVNNSLKRKLATCNCRHIKFPIILGISEPTYTQEEIKQYNEMSTKKMTVNGKEMTRYEASQYMRQVETEIRRQKEIVIAGKACGDNVLTADATNKIEMLLNEYSKIGNDAGLTLQHERTYVPEY